MAERIRAVVHGDVQGVGFRDFVQRRARELGLQGSVRNRRDGAVEVVAEGDRQDLKRLQEQLREGPRMASVNEIEITEEPATGEFRGFEITW